ncbi:hypothetical protein BGZ94_002082 [Podila epigama]|nr:hypothetical protein BGZ94_002082 [Podila epigama]
MVNALAQASHLHSPEKPPKVTRTTCCTAGLLRLLANNTHLREVQLRCAESFFHRDFTGRPDLSHIRVFEFEAEALVVQKKDHPDIFVPLEGEPLMSGTNAFNARITQFLDCLTNLKSLVLHCPDRPGIFQNTLHRMRFSLDVVAAVQRKRHRKRFPITFKVDRLSSQFIIYLINPKGLITDAGASFSVLDRDDDTDNESLVIPEDSPYVNIFKGPFKFPRLERFRAIGKCPLWCLRDLAVASASESMPVFRQLGAWEAKTTEELDHHWDEFLDNVGMAARISKFTMRNVQMAVEYQNALLRRFFKTAKEWIDFKKANFKGTLRPDSGPDYDVFMSDCRDLEETNAAMLCSGHGVPPPPPPVEDEAMDANDTLAQAQEQALTHAETIDKGKGKAVDDGQASVQEEGHGVAQDKGKGKAVDKGKGKALDKGKVKATDDGKSQQRQTKEKSFEELVKEQVAIRIRM